MHTAVQHLRERGVEGMGLRPLVAAADAPWGSLRHYFPQGKDQIVTEALEWSGSFAADVVTGYLDAARRPTGPGLVGAVIGWWIEDLTRRDFARGCPVAAIVAGGVDERSPIRRAAVRAFDVWAEPIRAGLVSMGWSPREAGELATLLLAALEGAVLMARARRSVAPLRVVERRLRPLFAVT